jgi:plasmid maintenance system killer protein
LRDSPLLRRELAELGPGGLWRALGSSRFARIAHESEELALDQASDVQDMNQPTFRLHPLKGNRKGVWAVTVRANWRATFRFEGGDAYDVDLEDYH